MKSFFEYTPMDIAELEDQSRKQLYIARKTRWKYRHDLQAALRDHEREPPPKLVLKPQPQQPQPTRQEVVAGLVAAPFFLAGALALFFFTLWVITGGPFK